MKQSGIPSVVKEVAGIAAAIALPEVTSVSLSGVMGNYLANQSAAAYVALDINQRKFAAGVAASGFPDEIDNAENAISSIGQGDYKVLTLQPTTGQTGRSLVFGSEGTTGDLVAPVIQSIAARLQPVAPKFTVESLVSMIASEIPADSNQKFLVVVDQENARVRIYAYEGNVPEDVQDLFDNTGDATKVVVALADPTVDNVTPLAFEGGAV